MSTPSNSDPESTTSLLREGQSIFNGRYELRRSLGRGGMGVVWLAQDRELEREVALKFIPEIVSTDPVALRDLKREVRRSIAYPNIVKIHDYVTDGRHAAVSMEYVEGETLSARRLAEPLEVFSPEQILPWVKQLCVALEYAHTKALVVHRDLKPANIMIDVTGEVKILDFGIAASISESASRVSNRGTSGTLSYMSPQQLLGKEPTPSDDWYALGATLYELLTGRPPFFRGDITHLVLNERPDPVSARRPAAAGPVPPSWESTIAALLAKTPFERPRNGPEILERLEAKSPPTISVRATPPPLEVPASNASIAPPPLPWRPLPPPATSRPLPSPPPAVVSPKPAAVEAKRRRKVVLIVAILVFGVFVALANERYGWSLFFLGVGIWVCRKR